MLQRIAYVRGIPAAAAECDSLESTSVLLPVLRDLCMDDDPEVRHAAAAVVGPLGEHARHASARRHAGRYRVRWALTPAPACRSCGAVLQASAGERQAWRW